MRSTISGQYKGVISEFEHKIAKATLLELRVDVDGKRPLNVVSGDLFSADTDEYLKSFRFQVNAPLAKAGIIRLRGLVGECSPCLDPIRNIEISINPNSHPLEASVRLTDNSGTKSNSTCQYKSTYFRNILLEHDYEEGVAPLEPYNPSSLPSPTQRKKPITINDAFAEAGVEVIEKKKQVLIPHPKGGPDEDEVWTDKRLYEAMLKHFTYASDAPQWKLWLLSAHEYVICTTEGIMLIYQGKSRRGCVVFQNATGWQTPEDKRLRLFIYMHELGHCFGLRHPWSSSRQNQESGFATLSWMNYPWRYRLSQTQGRRDFWRDFNFEFSKSELNHLRHGFRNNVIFGANTETGKENYIP